MPDPASRRVLLEVCVSSVEDALTANDHGADRLELCAALPLGGLTPSLGTLIEVKRAVALPVMVLVRPRPGGFAYSDSDFRTMLRDVELNLAHGADGIVCGVLNADGTIDAKRCRELVRAVGTSTAVFHRAFDVTPDPFVALEQIIDLGFRRILTSGQREMASDGAALIAELICHAAGRIEIMPGGGINYANVAELLTRTNCTEVHASLRGTRLDRSTAARPNVSFNSDTRSEDHYDATSGEAVAAVRALLGDS